MNKLYLFVLLFVTTLSSLSQASLATNVFSGTSDITLGGKDAKSMFGLNIVEYGRGSSAKENIIGSKYLFDNWNSSSRVLYDDKVFNLDYVNYNLKNDRFEVKLRNDSVLSIKPSKKIKQVEIKNMRFKTYYDHEKYSYAFIEVLWDSEDLTLLAKNELKVTLGDIDPLTKQYINPKEYVPEKNLFIMKGENLVPFKLKKSNVLGLVDDSYIKEVKSFVKQRKLKYNDVYDIQNLLTYYYSIKN